LRLNYTQAASGRPFGGGWNESLLRAAVGGHTIRRAGFGGSLGGERRRVFATKARFQIPSENLWPGGTCRRFLRNFCFGLGKCRNRRDQARFALFLRNPRAPPSSGGFVDGFQWLRIWAQTALCVIERVPQNRRAAGVNFHRVLDVRHVEKLWNCFEHLRHRGKQKRSGVLPARRALTKIYGGLFIDARPSGKLGLPVRPCLFRISEACGKWERAVTPNPSWLMAAVRQDGSRCQTTGTE